MAKKSFEKNVIGNDVILRAKEGDMAAREFILTCFFPLVLNLIKKYNIPGFTDEDLIQHCNVTLLNSIKLFNFSGFFPAYVKMALMNNLAYLCKRSCKGEPPLSLNVTSPDSGIEFINLIEDSGISLEEEFLREVSSTTLLSALEYLDAEEKSLVYFLLYADCPGALKAYSNKYNLSYIRCKYVKKKAFTKLRNILKNFYKKY